jgi:hypothetical protein
LNYLQHVSLLQSVHPQRFAGAFSAVSDFCWWASCLWACAGTAASRSYLGRCRPFVPAQIDKENACYPATDWWKKIGRLRQREMMRIKLSSGPTGVTLCAFFFFE